MPQQLQIKTLKKTKNASNTTEKTNKTLKQSTTNAERNAKIPETNCKNMLSKRKNKTGGKIKRKNNKCSKMPKQIQKTTEKTKEKN